MAFKPYMTSEDLIASIKRKISFPVSSSTFTEQEILQMASEEMAISSVPSILEFHEEYFVHPITVALEANKTRYEIPDRAIGMKLRDIKLVDSAGNLGDLVKVSSSDKAHWQDSSSNNASMCYYLEGNDIVFTSSMSDPTGSIIFYIYLRPNQLVLNERACIATNFVKTLTLASVVAGNTVVIDGTTLTAVSGSPAAAQFQIGASDTATAANLATAINTASLGTATSTSTVVSVRYSDLSTTFTASATITVQTTQGIEFDQVPSTWLDPDTNVTSALFVDGSEIDFLQTKPGHRTRGFDITIPTGGISGTIINFTDDDVPSTFLVGDYICMSHECIIPQIPPDLHNVLAERTGARMLASIGDQAGLQNSMLKLQEIDQRQNVLLDNRSESNPTKLIGRKSLLRSRRF